MASNNVKTGIFPLFTNDSQRFLASLRVVGMNVDKHKPAAKKNTTATKDEAVGTRTVTATQKSGISCSVCQVVFGSVDIQREHFKLDWHRFNLRQTLMGKPALNEETFEETMSGDMSSISGSDTSDDDDWSLESSSADLPVTSCLTSGSHDQLPVSQGRTLPRVYFINDDGLVISMYRNVLYSAKTAPETNKQLISLVDGMSHEKCWLVLLTSAGHFAAAVFDGSSVVAHKTFHRYTVRAKRGTAQSVRDGQQGGRAPRSAGAALRRHNEAALVQDVQELLEGWSDHIKRCHRIFVRVPEYSRHMIFGGRKPPISKDDTRLRTIPFPTRRPTFNEVKRVHAQLCGVEVLGAEADVLQGVMAKVTGAAKATEKGSNSEGELVPANNDQDEKCLQRTEEEARLEKSTSGINQLGQSNESAKSTDVGGQTKKKKSKTKKGPKHEQDASPQILLWNRLYCACVSGNVDVITSVLQTEGLSTSTEEETDDKAMLSSETNSESTVAEKLEEESPNGAREYEPSEQSTRTNNEGANTVPKDLSKCQGQNGDRDVVSNSQRKTADFNVVEVINGCNGDNGETLLHGASRHAHSGVITLLLEHGADPAVRDRKGRPPYCVAGDKESRNTFRRFMAAQPGRYDYVKAQIPSPLTSEMEEGKERKNAEIKKAQRKGRKDRLKVQKAEEKKKEEEQREQKRLQSLSDREKRALAAERRFAQQKAAVAMAAGSLCEWCSKSLAGLVPFERLSFKYCATACVTAHRKALESQAR